MKAEQEQENLKNQIKEEEKNQPAIYNIDDGSARIIDGAFQINFIVDDNKSKHFKFTPGDRIKVLPSYEIYKGNTDYLVIFAWEHQKKIMKKHQKFKKQGGKFINILPNFKVIS